MAFAVGALAVAVIITNISLLLVANEVRKGRR